VRQVPSTHFDPGAAGHAGGPQSGERVAEVVDVDHFSEVGRPEFDLQPVGLLDLTGGQAACRDARGALVIPGLVDCHTHLAFGGWRADEFELDGTDGKKHRLADLRGPKGTLVMFICNHCPFVQHIAAGLAQFALDYQPRGIACVAISSNDVVSHPDDTPDKMAQFARQNGFVFPYLYDESQRTALGYEAICTPDFYLFDQARHLVYRGQFDASRPHTEWDVRAGRARNMVPVTGADLRAATEALLTAKPPLADQIPSAGCSIKWKPANEPDWA